MGKVKLSRDRTWHPLLIELGHSSTNRTEAPLCTASLQRKHPQPLALQSPPLQQLKREDWISFLYKRYDYIILSKVNYKAKRML